MRSLLVLSLALAANGESISGKWQVHTVAQGNERHYTCTINQEAQALSGTCNTGERTVQLAGKVDGKKVTWTYKSEYNGSPLTVVFKGAIESPTKMAGTVLAEEFNVEGDFTATAAK
jgi:hypothetical protein